MKLLNRVFRRLNATKFKLLFHFHDDYRFSDDGLIIYTNFGKILIKWDDFISMSEVMINELFYYQIKTKVGVIELRVVTNADEFERTITEKANLTIFEENCVCETDRGTKAKRWNKVGMEYQTTGLADRIMVGYSSDNHKRSNLNDKVA